jgi:hypothetical protein
MASLTAKAEKKKKKKNKKTQVKARQKGFGATSVQDGKSGFAAQVPLLVGPKLHFAASIPEALQG